MKNKGYRCFQSSISTSFVAFRIILTFGLILTNAGVDLIGENGCLSDVMFVFWYTRHLLGSYGHNKSEVVDFVQQKTPCVWNDDDKWPTPDLHG